ncbi:MAG: RNA polymerase factor sigma-54 [Panacagrimonas sp.]
MPSVGFALKTQTRLSASPHMQQAVHMLQLSAVEFAQELQQALTTNPFLEEVEAGEMEQDPTSELQGTESPGDGIDGDGPGEGADPMEAPTGDVPVSEAFDQVATREEPRDPFDITPSTSSAASAGSSTNDPCDWVCAQTSLREHLLQQICGWGVVDQRRRMAAAIVVDSLDDDGYLRSDVQEAAADSGLDPALSEQEIDQAIRFVQTCDPAGVGARNVGECLALQIEALGDSEASGPLAALIVSQHLDLLAHHRYASLRQLLSCDDEALNNACSLIRRLDPKPGHRFTSQRPEYVVPDVIVRMHGGELITLVNPAARPSARLNQCYAQWFRAARHQDHPALSQQLQEARWLMHNVEQRFVTIQRVAEAIVRRQRGFFDGGEIAMKPLVLREVADDLGIHESTVSRATGNKYMDTPRGLFEFRHFFSRSLATETGGSCSAASVRALMSDMLASETATTPLSDVALTKMLGQNGVRVSRRTVTKYRNLMKVASVEMRKRA